MADISHLEGLLRHDNVLAARVARSAVAREDLLTRTSVARERRHRRGSKNTSRDDGRNLGGQVHVELGQRGVEGERGDGDREPAASGTGAVSRGPGARTTPLRPDRRP